MTTKKQAAQPITTMKTNYDIDYFISKFSAIPDERWAILEFGQFLDGPHCALGHCGQRSLIPDADGLADTHEAQSLLVLFRDNGIGSVAAVNDGMDMRFDAWNAKTRILRALHFIKARAEAELDRYETRPLLPATKPAQPTPALP
jgi:hypothetical protein